MIELHWTEIDGVTVVWAEAPGPLRAGLLFRTGRADETLATSGHTHLVEHMALSPLIDTLHRHNGMVDGAMTGFFTAGRPAEVSEFLAHVCGALASLPGERLEEEKRVLEAERATRSHDFCGHLLVWRYGASGYGLLGMPELGLRSANLERLREFCAQRFTTGNAVLWLTGPPPADLRLQLPQGEKLPPPPLAPIQNTFPGCFPDNACGGLAAGAIIPRACASLLFGDIAQVRLRKRLRHELALSYSPAVYYFPLDVDHAHVVLHADAEERRRAELAGAFGELFQGIAEYEESEVEASRERILEHWSGSLAPPLEERVTSEVSRVAADWLFGQAFEPRAALESQLAAASRDDLAAIGRAAQSTAIFALPGSAQLEPWCGAQIPASTVPPVHGRDAGSVDAPFRKERLRYGPDGVSALFLDGSHCTVRYEGLAAALQYDDGCVTLIGRDAATLTIEPTLWQSGHDICRWIRGRIPAHLLLEQPPRSAGEIPRPGSTALQRLLARIGLIDS